MITSPIAGRPAFAMLVLLAAACGGGGGMTSPSRNNNGGGNPLPQGSPQLAVAVQDFSFAPGSVTVAKGTTVTWSNNGPTAHTVTSDVGTWDSGQLASPTPGGGLYGGMSAGGAFQFTFTLPGTYLYHCANHPGMTGTVVVNP
jgi:plastocyanin